MHLIDRVQAVEVVGAIGGRANSAGGKRSRYAERSGSFSTVRFNVGRKEQITPPDIIGIINRATRGTSVEIGRIDLVVSAVAGATYRGRQLRVEATGFEPERSRKGGATFRSTRSGRRGATGREPGGSRR